MILIYFKKISEEEPYEVRIIWMAAQNSEICAETG